MFVWWNGFVHRSGSNRLWQVMFISLKPVVTADTLDYSVCVFLYISLAVCLSHLDLGWRARRCTVAAAWCHMGSISPFSDRAVFLSAVAWPGTASTDKEVLGFSVFCWTVSYQLFDHQVSLIHALKSWFWCWRGLIWTLSHSQMTSSVLRASQKQLKAFQFGSSKRCSPLWYYVQHGKYVKSSYVMKSS